MLLKSRASPDMLPFSLCNKNRLAIRHMNRPPLSKDTIDSVLRHRDVGRAKDLSAHHRRPLSLSKRHVKWFLISQAIEPQSLSHCLCVNAYSTMFSSNTSFCLLFTAVLAHSTVSNCFSLVLAVWLFTVYAIYLMSLRLYTKVTLSFEKIQEEEQWPGSSTSGMSVTYLYVPIIYHTCCGQHSHWRAYGVCQVCQAHTNVSKYDVLCIVFGVVCIFRLIRKVARSDY